MAIAARPAAQHAWSRVTAAIVALLCAAPAFAQTGTIIPWVTQQFLDASGNPVNLGKLCSYAAGTSTPQATYSDVSLMTANANPVRTSSNGRPTTGAIFLSPTSYKFELRTAGTDNTCSTGTVLWTLDNVSAVPTASGNVDVTGTAGETLAAGDVVYLSDGSNSLTAGRFYKADADFTYASSNAGIIGIASAAIASGSSGSIRLVGQFSGLSGLTAGMTYFVSATAGQLTATAPSNTRIVGQAISTTTIDFASNPRAVLTQPVNVAEGRLTATSGTPVTTGDVSAATAIYYTPYKGNRISLYDGAIWNIRYFSELTISVSSCTATKPYDIFIYDNAGTPAAEQLVWTNATTRATALVLQDGALVKSGATTRRYVGTYYCNATGGQTDDTAAKRYVWNYYNRVRRQLLVKEATDSWTYSTATWRQANAAAGNQLDFVIGWSEDEVMARIVGSAECSCAADNNMLVSVGLDSTSAPSAVGLHPFTRATVSNIKMALAASWNGYPGVGRHVLVWLETGGGAATITWYGDGGGTDVQTGIAGEIEG